MLGHVLYLCDSPFERVFFVSSVRLISLIDMPVPYREHENFSPASSFHLTASSRVTPDHDAGMRTYYILMLKSIELETQPSSHVS